MPNAPRVHAYIDETGDRGSSARSSPIFGMAAVVLDERGVGNVRRAISSLRQDFKVPGSAVMSWKHHLKTHDRRRRAAEVLGAVEGLRVCYVYAIKDELWPGTYRDDPTRFYNYVAFQTYKSVLWAARDWKGNARVWTRFGHVKGHDHRATDAYIRREAGRDERVPFHFEQGLRWVDARTYAESQVADLYGGFLKAATWPSGEFNYVESAYLLKIWPQIRKRDSCAIPLGIRSMPRNELVRKNDWFPCVQCSNEISSPRASRGRST
ncbi:DUF3800 domain-containing protein [Saccharopolyspora sp. TS4A08]|uniref:DUF3800 domain-containing protein n=1 Tax=Saccharopolyspora ipomoeae TaxID=3042027 RepID=A0ABT6PVR7_9PSEU|nr:DUF3800 domain-containing protein [Saccharopolyspora sp. TS4A08]MDI2032101.1 DUF3800 domain-containing protein [Saccharopolyspora sp. TS4A08]